MMKTKEQKLTEGSPAKLIFVFAIPLMLGNMFQQFYTIVDTMIVSRALGVEALAALGTADWYLFMVIALVQALAQGCSILLAQDFGADDIRHLNKSLAHATVLCAAAAVLLAAAATVAVYPVLALLGSPMEIRPMAATYMTILFLGIPATTLFNLTASVLRALGNSRLPLWAMVIASLLNIALDYLLVVVIPLGVGGAAIATVIAQLIAGLFCLGAVSRMQAIHLQRSDFQMEMKLNVKLLSLSTPMILQNLLIGVGGVIVISVVNGLGVTFIAGYTATNKLYGALEAAGIAYGYAILTYMGQNYGAGKTERLRSGLRDGLIIGVITSACIGGAMILFGHQIIGLFLSGDAASSAEAAAVAYHYLFVMSAFLPILYVLHITRSALQGLGDTVRPMISGFAEFAMRTVMALVLTRYLGGSAIMYGEVAAWTGADVVLVPAIRRRIARG